MFFLQIHGKHSHLILEHAMPEFTNIKIIEHRFHFDNNKVKSSIGYGMIVGHDLMVQLGLSADFNHHDLQWDFVTVPMKEPSGLLGKSDLTSRKMCEVVIHTA